MVARGDPVFGKLVRTELHAVLGTSGVVIDEDDVHGSRAGRGRSPVRAACLIFASIASVAPAACPTRDPVATRRVPSGSSETREPARSRSGFSEWLGMDHWSDGRGVPSRRTDGIGDRPDGTASPRSTDRMRLLLHPLGLGDDPTPATAVPPCTWTTATGITSNMVPSGPWRQRRLPARIRSKTPPNQQVAGSWPSF